MLRIARLLKSPPPWVSARIFSAAGFRSSINPFLLRRSITTVQHVPKRRPLGLYLLGATILAAYGYWKYITHHNFPPTVAALLKEGLWATINGGGYRKPDYRQALAKYIAALQEADRLNMVPWSDEYTGIQIVIADMYERLHLEAEAAAMYAEMGNTFLMALTRNLVPPQDREKIITKDLQVVLLATLLMPPSGAGFRSAVDLMAPHLVLATKEAALKSEELDFLLHEQPAFDIGYLNDIKTKQLPSDLLKPVWGAYRTELVAMREMMTGMAAANGEYMQALTIKLKTTQIMLTSGFSAGECLLSAVNIASLMYLESVSRQFTKSSNDAANLDTGSEKTASLMNEENLASAQRGHSLVSLPRSAGSPSTDLPRKPLKPTPEVFMALANDVYTEVVNTINSLDQRRTDFVPEAYVMALYGQGVIATNRGDWSLAADRLQEARLRAKGSQLDSLISTVESEIAKVEKMRHLSEEEVRQLRPSELPSVDVMFWKLMPETDDLDRPDLPEPRF